MKDENKRAKINVRLQVVRALHEINYEGGFANIVLQQYIERNHFSDMDRRFFTELVYGVVRRKNYLDAIISRFTKKPVSKLSPWIVDILRLGIYQIKFMDRIPYQAAVNESVKLAKKLAHGLAPLVNGVLRNYLRQFKDINIETLANSEIERLALEYNLPLWMLEEWTQTYTFDEIKQMCVYFNEIPRLTGRLNLHAYTKDEIIKALEAEQVEWSESRLFPEGIIIHSHKGTLKQAKWMQDGYITFMDEGSLAIVHVLDPQPGERILDVCAAPGGKTLHAASLMKNRGFIKACDIYDTRLSLIQENAKRLHVSIVTTALQDGRFVDKNDIEQYDRVLVDAPCSGLGILQKKLDMRWTKEKEILTSLCELQYEILVSASKAVKKDGILVYSTCTLNRNENEGIINKFLVEHPHFELEDASQWIPFSVPGPMVTLTPFVYHTDGFFIARMKKKEQNI